MDRAIVHVLPTLHQYHAATPGYGFDVLARVLEELAPDVLVLELTESALRLRRPQPVKREYQHCVFPYLERRGIPAVAMEPGEPLYSELVEQGLEAERLYQSLWPERYAKYELDVVDSFHGLLRSWDSAKAVDSARTDRLLQDKHQRENELFGAKYQDTWDRYNEHFAQVIARTAQGHPGQRVVAVTGVEHCYWLRPRLQALAQADGTWTLAPRLGDAQEGP